MIESQTQQEKFVDIRKYTLTPPPTSTLPQSNLRLINPRLLKTDIKCPKPVVVQKLPELPAMTIEQSKSLQEKYEKGSLEQKNHIFKTDVQPFIVDLSLNKYMHYLLEMILERGLLGHKQWIFETILNSKDIFWSQKYAQKIFAKSLQISKWQSPDHYAVFFKHIMNKETLKLMKYDPQGNQIVQKCLEIFDEEELTVLLSDLNKCIMYEEFYPVFQQLEGDLCTHQFGCLIVIKLIEVAQNATGKPKLIINKILERIVVNSVELSMKKYANYVIQQLLLRSPYQNQLVDEYLLKNFKSLSTNKFGSNVAEKVVEYSLNPDLIFSLIQEYVEIFVNDQYANYVLQRLYRQAPNVRGSIKFTIQELEKNKRLNLNGQIVYRFIQNFDHNYS